jgi:hypothetical protein
MALIVNGAFAALIKEENMLAERLAVLHNAIEALRPLIDQNSTVMELDPLPPPRSVEAPAVTASGRAKRGALRNALYEFLLKQRTAMDADEIVDGLEAEGFRLNSETRRGKGELVRVTLRRGEGRYFRRSPRNSGYWEALKK